MGPTLKHLSGEERCHGTLYWRPASYGASGIMTFIVNQDGIVFQKDLGPNTAKVVAATKTVRAGPELGAR
jgi:hypothetical protein